MTSAKFEEYRDDYAKRLEGLFLPGNIVNNDPIYYFSSLLRVYGMEDSGWDPYGESRQLLNDINGIFGLELPSDRFPKPDLTVWRLGLFMYSHIIEMDAPYEVIVNLLRFKIGDSYSPNPYFKYMNNKQKKKFKRSNLSPLDKINIIRKLDKLANTEIASIFDEFYEPELRNAIAHSDFVVTDTKFRARNSRNLIPIEIELDIVDTKITKSKAFIASVFKLDYISRKVLARDFGNMVVPYDAKYKGLLEILVNDDGAMCGFKIHWPNNSDSYYKRGETGVDMVNMMISGEDARPEPFVGRYAVRPGNFSPLVENDDVPRYSKLENGEDVAWPSELE